MLTYFLYATSPDADVAAVGIEISILDATIDDQLANLKKIKKIKNKTEHPDKYDYP